MEGYINCAEENSYFTEGYINWTEENTYFLEGYINCAEENINFSGEIAIVLREISISPGKQQLC